MGNYLKIGLAMAFAMIATPAFAEALSISALLTTLLNASITIGGFTLSAGAIIGALATTAVGEGLVAK